MFPQALGSPLSKVRVVSISNKFIPFQIDEITAKGEYICPQGEEPNPNDGNGILDPQDEIVFLAEDLDSSSDLSISDNAFISTSRMVIPISLDLSSGQKKANLVIGENLPVLNVKYMEYDDSKQFLKTPLYYAQFARERFHMTSAGVYNTKSKTYTKLTNELRVELLLRALWGLLPIRYTEESIVCHVRRYKVGPIRVIRRGDFHLNLGLGVKGSHAAVNQICYPQMVNVPVHIHLPVKFKTLFKEAYVEMTPVIRHEGRNCTFAINQDSISLPVSGNPRNTLLYKMPNHRLITLSNGQIGYGWLLDADMKNEYLGGSGYVLNRPSVRTGIADCGYRLAVRDVPKGRYKITNWVLFTNDYNAGFRSLYSAVVKPCTIKISSKTYKNLLTSGPDPIKGER